MSRNQYSLSKQLAVAAALALGTSGVALADDNSMSPLTGDSYAYFNGGRNYPYGKPVFNNAPLSFRQTSPHGLSVGEYQALSSDGLAWPLPNQSAASAIAATDAAKSFHQTHPHGLPFGEYEALSSADPAWRLTQAGTGARAATNESAAAKSATDEPSRTGIGRLFDLFHAGRATSTN